ncbi:hypothetical protein TKK_0014666 [Trichogramma kaykai]
MCRKGFAQVRTLLTHITEYHYIPTSSIAPECPNQSKKRKYETFSTNWSKLNFDSHVTNMVANLRLNTTITATNIGFVTDAVQKLLGNVMNEVEEKIKDFVNEFNVKVSDDHLENFLNQFHCDSKDFSYVKSMRSQVNAIKKMYDYIEPTETFMGRKNTDDGGSKDEDTPLLKHITIPYVSIIEIIKLVFSKDEIANFNKNKRISQENDLLTRFEDGEIFQEHPFFQKYIDAIAFVLYYDEFLVNNPIGTKARKQKLGVFYISFLNLPDHIRDYIGNVHILAIAKHEDIVKYGIDRCLSGFIVDLMQLESDKGVSCVINGKKYTFRATLVGVIADTLAAHELFGFLSPSARYFCRMCLITKEQRMFFPLVDAKLRTKDLHDSCIKELQDDEIESIMGVQKDCILHKSSYFHCTNNFIFDIMHDILEGQAQLDLCLVICKFVQDKKYNITVKLLNYRIENFKYGPLEYRNKPSSISKDSIKNNNLQQRAAQTWCLLRIFPFIVSDKVPEDDPFLQHIININKINEIIFAPKVPLSCLSYLQELIDNHIEQFQKLFPDTNIINKLMHMRHYPMCIKKSGPLSLLSCFKYEAKHNMFIKYGNLSNNYKNLPKTMITIAQISQSSVWGKREGTIREKFNFTSYEESTDIYTNMLRKLINKELITENIKVLNSIHIYSKMYQTGLFIVLKKDTEDNGNMPLFGKIQKIIMYDDDVFFYYKNYNTLYFDDSLNAYRIEENNSFDIKNYESLLDPHALSEWKNHEGFSYICLHHMLI